MDRPCLENCAKLLIDSGSIQKLWKFLDGESILRSFTIKYGFNAHHYKIFCDYIKSWCLFFKINDFLAYFQINQIIKYLLLFLVSIGLINSFNIELIINNKVVEKLSIRENGKYNKTIKKIRNHEIKNNRWSNEIPLFKES
jgi:hypothetical protein